MRRVTAEECAGTKLALPGEVDEVRLGRLPRRGFESRRIRKSLRVVGHRKTGPFPSESCLLVVKIRYTSAKRIESEV